MTPLFGQIQGLIYQKSWVCFKDIVSLTLTLGWTNKNNPLIQLSLTLKQFFTIFTEHLRVLRLISLEDLNLKFINNAIENNLIMLLSSRTPIQNTSQITKIFKVPFIFPSTWLETNFSWWLNIFDEYKPEI